MRKKGLLYASGTAIQFGEFGALLHPPYFPPERSIPCIKGAMDCDYRGSSRVSLEHSRTSFSMYLSALASALVLLPFASAFISSVAPGFTGSYKADQTTSTFPVLFNTGSTMVDL